MVSKNRGNDPKSSILMGFSLTNHPFWDDPSREAAAGWDQILCARGEEKCHRPGQPRGGKGRKIPVDLWGSLGTDGKIGLFYGKIWEEKKTYIYIYIYQVVPVCVCVCARLCVCVCSRL